MWNGKLEINPFFHKLLLVMTFYYSNRNPNQGSPPPLRLGLRPHCSAVGREVIPQISCTWSSIWPVLIQLITAHWWSTLEVHAHSDDSKKVKNLSERQGEGDGKAEEFEVRFLLALILEVKHFYSIYKGWITCSGHTATLEGKLMQGRSRAQTRHCRAMSVHNTTLPEIGFL